MISSAGLLFIEPQGAPSPSPLIDHLTAKMAAALRQALGTGHLDSTGIFTPDMGTRGWHECSCGATSDSVDFALPSGEVTNSLCVHYLAFHRNEVPAAQLARVAALPVQQVVPTDGELKYPPKRRSSDPFADASRRYRLL